jgi:hypothetical protein
MVRSCRSFCAIRGKGHPHWEDARSAKPCNIRLVAGRLPPWSPSDLRSLAALYPQKSADRRASSFLLGAEPPDPTVRWLRRCGRSVRAANAVGTGGQCSRCPRSLRWCGRSVRWTRSARSVRWMRWMQTVSAWTRSVRWLVRAARSARRSVLEARSARRVGPPGAVGLTGQCARHGRPDGSTCEARPTRQVSAPGTDGRWVSARAAWGAHDAVGQCAGGVGRARCGGSVPGRRGARTMRWVSARCGRCDQSVRSVRRVIALGGVDRCAGRRLSGRWRGWAACGAGAGGAGAIVGR